MRITCFVMFLLVAAFSQATEVSVGGVSVAIPNPTGFSPVTQEMGAVHDYLLLFVPPDSEQLLAFISDLDVPAARTGEIPDMSRRFLVQTLKGMAGTSISRSYFEELKAVVKSKNAEIFSKARERLPGLTERLNQEAAETHDLDLAFSVSQMIPMPVHEETDRTLAFSAWAKFEMNDESGNPGSYVAVVTATFVHVHGKILILMSCAEDSALEWSRVTSSQWANAVVAANLQAEVVASYQRIEVEHGISIEVPTHWKVESLEERKKQAATVDALLKGTDWESQPDSIDSLSVVSLPDPTGASVGLWFRPASGLTQTQWVQHLESDPEGMHSGFRNALSAKFEQMRKVHEQAGVAVIGEYEGGIAKAGALHGHVTRYRWRADDGVGVYFEQKYYIAMGKDELIATFSYRESDDFPYHTIMEKIIHSLRWSERSDPSRDSDPQQPD